MSVFDQIDQLFGGASGQASGEPALLRGVVEMLTQGGSGGLQNLVKGFQTQGLGEIVSSWIGTGDNLPVTAEQVRQGLGAEHIQRLAEQAGISSEVVSGTLARILPGLVDGLTPNGSIPEGGLVQQAATLLKGWRS